VRCEHEVCVGAYVLDALEPDEQLRMQLHVPECPVCSASARELERLPGLLAGTPAEVPEAPVPSELAFERFRRSAAGVAPPGPRSRRRWWIAAAAAVLVLAAAAVGGVVLAGRGPAPQVVEAAADGVHLSASYLAAEQGTDVTVQLDGVPMGERCELVAVDARGREESAGNWRVGYAGTFSWTGWVAMEPDEVARWVVRTTDGETLVSVPA
jgi:anti-sigma factor RsiW